MKSPRFQSAGVRAFTLIEVLVSLAILAIATVALGSAYVNLLLTHDNLRKSDGSQDELRWVRLVLLAEPDREKAERGGEVVMPDGRSASWRAIIEPSTVSDLFDVKLSVEMPPPEGSGTLVRRETTLRLLRPTWSTEAESKKLTDSARKRLEKSREAMR